MRASCGKRILKWGILAGAVLWGTLTMPAAAQVQGPQPHKPWSVGGTMGFLANTPDDTAFALNFNADANVNRHVALGPLLQLGFTGDLVLVGLSGQGKYAMRLPIADSSDRFKLIFQGGIGFVHADRGASDTSFLIPLGIGVDYQINRQMAFKSDFLLNFTDLDLGPGRGNNDTNVMPGLTFGVRF